MEYIPQDAVFTFPLEGGVTLAAHKFVLAAVSPAFKTQFYEERFKEEQVEVVDHSRAVFGLFLDTLYGVEPAWATTSLLTIYGMYCLQDKHLVTALAAATLEQVAAREVAAEDIRGLAEVKEAIATCHPNFVAAVETAV